MTKLKRFLTPFGAVALLAFAVVVLIFTVHNAGKAGEAMAAAGQGIGESVGRFKGSIEGISDYNEKYDEGKDQGLEAEDTQVSGVSGQLELGAGKLQVLAATVSLIVDNQVSDKYAALALLRGNLVFTVDLGSALVEGDTITLPDVEAAFSVNNGEAEIIDEYQRSYFGAAIEDGYTEYLNTVERVRDNVEAYVEDYDGLLASARESALEQVSMIAGNVSGKRYTVTFEKGA